MKNKVKYLISMMLILSLCLTGCGGSVTDPGTPPEEVLHPEINEQEDTKINNDTIQQPANAGIDETESESILENAVSVRIGLLDRTSYAVDMINNDAANTMIGYLSGSEMRFPTYTYDEEGGYVAQSIRGSYTRDDEEEITDVKAGELYLLSGGQLRLYFKDIDGAGITATPVGKFQDSEAVKTAVPTAYEENRDDTWNVDVYFLIKKN